VTRARPVRGAAGAPPTSAVNVHIRLICGGITKVKAPIAIGARYDGLPFAGPTAAFDRLLDSWMTRAVDLGIIGSALGLLFPIDLEQYHQARKVKAKTLILVGMGEPGRFAPDSLQFITSNIVVAVKAMGQSVFASTLIGTRRKELSISDAVRGFLQGISDGYERFGAIVRDVKRDEESLRPLVSQPLEVLLVVGDEKKRDEVEKELNSIVRDSSIPSLKLTVDRGPDADPDDRDPKTDRDPTSADQDENVNYLRITRSKSTASSKTRPSRRAGRNGAAYGFRALPHRGVPVLRIVRLGGHPAARTGGQCVSAARRGRADDKG